MSDEFISLAEIGKSEPWDGNVPEGTGAGLCRHGHAQTACSQFNFFEGRTCVETDRNRMKRHMKKAKRSRFLSNYLADNQMDMLRLIFLKLDEISSKLPKGSVTTT